MSNIKVTIKDINTLRLEENAKIGDTIDLKSLHSVDDTFIIDAINQKKDEVYKQLLSNVRRENETAIELSLAKEKQLFEQEKNLLNNKLIELKNQLENQNKTHNQANEFLRKELNSSFELEKQRLLNEINSLKETHEQKVKNIELMTRQNLESIYKDKLNEKDLMIQEQRLKLESNLTKHQLSISETKQKYEEQIFNQQKEIENLKRERSLRNIKQIGEDLENWCNEQFKSISLYGFKTSTFEKDNRSEEHTSELQSRPHLVC